MLNFKWCYQIWLRFWINTWRKGDVWIVQRSCLNNEGIAHDNEVDQLIIANQGLYLEVTNLSLHCHSIFDCTYDFEVQLTIQVCIWWSQWSNAWQQDSPLWGQHLAWGSIWWWSNMVRERLYLARRLKLETNRDGDWHLGISSDFKTVFKGHRNQDIVLLSNCCIRWADQSALELTAWKLTRINLEIWLGLDCFCNEIAWRVEDFDLEDARVPHRVRVFEIFDFQFCFLVIG